MMIVHTLTADSVVEINQLICADGGNRHQCYGIGKVESALHSAFYPGDYPFQHGGVACLAGALCFYLTQAHAFYDGNKRTALIASLTFLDLNGWDLQYPMDVGGKTAVADIIERCADGKVTKEEMIEWFDRHKIIQQK
ncbi:MAG: type II toxin-antitoxin system death-on-curing family toxin [Pseudomonadota bacterium]